LFCSKKDRKCSLYPVALTRAKVGVVGSNPIARSKSLNKLVDQGGGPEGGLSAECPRNLFAARSSQDPLLAQDTSEASGDSSPVLSGDQTSPKIRVRERCTAPAVHLGYQDHTEGLAHPSNRLIAQLNENWRVVDDSLQWILQRRKGRPRAKNSGWQNRAYFSTWEGLVRRIRACCGEIDADAFAELRGLPDNHSDNGHIA
jgi:hypothetical protein